MFTGSSFPEIMEIAQGKGKVRANFFLVFQHMVRSNSAVVFNADSRDNARSGPERIAEVGIGLKNGRFSGSIGESDVLLRVAHALAYDFSFVQSIFVSPSFSQS